MNSKKIIDAIAAERQKYEKNVKELTLQLRVFQLEEQVKKEKAYESRKENLNITGNWLKEKQIIRIGDLVKVTGSRAGPYRQIAAILNDRIVGNVAVLKREKKQDGTYIQFWSTKHFKVTEQGFNKITHIFRSGKFVPVKELMENNHNNH
jgi:hypothetical protein